jgi:hypothetical protein
MFVSQLAHFLIWRLQKPARDASILRLWFRSRKIKSLIAEARGHSDCGGEIVNAMISSFSQRSLWLCGGVF